MDFVKKHKDLFTFLGLLSIFYLIFFYGIGSYALMDSDETRYVWMARDMFNLKDFMTLKLDGAYFFEKPPLYFWGECLSFMLFGKITEFSARFPAALYGTISCFWVYFVGKRLVSRSYGIISALILATSLEFIVLSKLAILDILLTMCVGLSLYAGFMTFFCKEKNKKYFWWLFYFFSGLSVMAKGIPGFVIPFGSMFFASVFSRKFKDIFKPQYFLVGSLIFLAVVLPWHILMLKTYNPLFFDEYIMKHHVARFLSSKDLGRKEAFYFFFLVILWGFIPWILSAAAVCISKLKKIKFYILEHLEWETLADSRKFMILNWVALLFILIFFSSSSTKLITYILPIYFPMAFLMGWVWTNYIEKSDYKTPVNLSVYIFNTLLILGSIAAVFMALFLPEKLLIIVNPVKWFGVAVLFSFPIIGIVSALKDRRMAVFASYIALMTVLSAFGTGRLFNLAFEFGQEDLMEFAQYAKAHNSSFASFGFGRRYSLGYYYDNGDKIVFEQGKDYRWLRKHLHKKNSIAVIKKKDLKKISKHVRFKVIKYGEKYVLIK